jgi:CheY-like chemotaxis protein
VVATLAELLSIDGHLVDTATTGAKALDKLQKHSYDLILSDLRLPDGTREPNRTVHSSASIVLS